MPRTVPVPQQALPKWSALFAWSSPCWEGVPTGQESWAPRGAEAGVAVGVTPSLGCSEPRRWHPGGSWRL